MNCEDKSELIFGFLAFAGHVSGFCLLIHLFVYCFANFGYRPG